MKLGVLFSGGKDSTMATWLAKKAGHEIACLITLHSENPDSYMFHTPSIKRTERQAAVMNLPLITKDTKGVKEKELEDLKEAIKAAIKKYNIKGIVTGALHSDYQASRIQKICDGLGLQCINPLWHKDEFQYLQDIIKNKFKVIIIGVSAYPLSASWLGRVINEDFIRDVTKLHEKYKIHVAGEGGEFESFVLDCPLFKRPLKFTGANFTGEDHSWKMEIEVE
ncbi:MAG: diphthine--ammonia ligase [Candidatus Pacearchaeota archaeon]|nr:diphthine--ammonia ligase [Nanoarchaeota archaeon]MDZ4226506.1 diphthine--ammonia ligase [Candidatus Pacearchaeota archaeon]